MSRSALKKSVGSALVSVTRSIPLVNRYMYTFSKVYIDAYRHFSYDPAVNGESALIRKIAAHTGKAEDFVFFDIGANVGDWTRDVLSHIPGAHGHVFELCQGTFRNLEKNLSGYDHLTLNNMAVSDKDGTIEYKYFGENFGSNTTVMGNTYFSSPHEILTAEVVTGASYCQKNDIDHIHLLKIDTEGAEYYVLKGWEDMFARKAVDIIQFEYGYTHADTGVVMRDFFKFFEDLGYIVGRLEPTGVRFKAFEYSDNDFKSGPNYVACLPAFKDWLGRF